MVYFIGPLQRPLKTHGNLIQHPNIVKDRFFQMVAIIVCTPPPFCLGGEGGEGSASYQIFKKGGVLTGPQFLEGGCWERGVTFFRGGGQFLHKK